MHLTNILLLGAAAANAVASNLSPVFKRQTLVPIPCSEQGRKSCGTGCIPLTYTCCPDRRGGCPISAYCDLGDNGIYGCCPLGERCVGNGGVHSEPGQTFTSTIVSTQTLPPPPPPVETTLPPKPDVPSSTEVPEPETSTSEEPKSEQPPAEETVTSAPLPSPIPTNGTGAPTTTGEPPVITAAAVSNGLSFGLLGSLLGVAALLL